MTCKYKYTIYDISTILFLSIISFLVVFTVIGLQFAYNQKIYGTVIDKYVITGKNIFDQPVSVRYYFEIKDTNQEIYIAQVTKEKYNKININTKVEYTGYVQKK